MPTSDKHIQITKKWESPHFKQSYSTPGIFIIAQGSIGCKQNIPLACDRLLVLIPRYSPPKSPLSNSLPSSRAESERSSSLSLLPESQIFKRSYISFSIFPHSG